MKYISDLNSVTRDQILSPKSSDYFAVGDTYKNEEGLGICKNLVLGMIFACD